MYTLKIETSFAAAHNLRNYKGKCEHLHGHNWKVVTEVTSVKLNEIGIVLDFKELKTMVNSIINELDHFYLNEIPPFNELNPSSENIANYIFTSLKNKINDINIKVEKVSVWESQDACASYWE